jgi:hypothetical protein
MVVLSYSKRGCWGLAPRPPGSASPRLGSGAALWEMEVERSKGISYGSFMVVLWYLKVEFWG